MRISRGLLFATACSVAALIAVSTSVTDAAACDRSPSALETPAVGVAVADVVVVAEVVRVGGGVATVKIAERLKGSDKGTSPGDTIQVRGALSVDESAKSGDCGVVPLAAGKTYVFLLWSPIAGSSDHHLIDPMGGVLPAAQRTAMQQALAQKHPRSPWRSNSNGVQTQLLLAPNAAATKGDVDLLVLLRNTNRAAMDFQYADWPEATQSRCALKIADVATKVAVPAKDVPISKKDIADYFSKHGRTYRVRVEPGAAHLFLLQRVTTARSGWGYKEELGFRYYPVAKSAPHSITADCTNLFGPGSTTATEPVVIPL